MPNRVTNLHPAWDDDRYYQLARDAILNSKSLGLDKLIEIANTTGKILDIGCGEGTRLSRVAGKKEGWGVDISTKAISLAKKQYPQYKFVKADITKRLPFAAETFDLVYSAFVLEHIMFPERMIKEAYRVLKKGGVLCLIAPNYGAPNRVSPVFKGSRIKTFLTRIFYDYFPHPISGLHWSRVTPILGVYEQDSDTVIEPYAGTLKRFLLNLGFNEININTSWNEELLGAKIHQKVFRRLGEWGIYPFYLWGPQLVVWAKKIS